MTAKTESTQRLQTLGEHQALLHRVLTTAQKRVIIVSPFISVKAIEYDNIHGLASQAVSRGVQVRVFTDHLLNFADGEMKPSAKDGIVTLIKYGAKVYVVEGIHNKTLIRDTDLIAEGSFNWLSAVRIQNAESQREERTLVYTGENASKMIEEELMSIEKIGYDEATLKKTEITENYSKVGTVMTFCIILAIPVLTGHDIVERIGGCVCVGLFLSIIMGLFRIKGWIDSKCDQTIQQDDQLKSTEDDEPYAWEMREQPGQISTNANNAYGTLPGNIIGPAHDNILTH